MSAAAIVMPKASHEILQSIIASIVARVCVNDGILVNVAGIFSSCLGHKNEQHDKNIASEVLMILNNTIVKNPHGVYASADKANSGKGGVKCATYPNMIHVTDPENLEVIHEDRIHVVKALHTYTLFNICV